MKVFIYQINNSCNWPLNRVSFAQVHSFPGYETRSFSEADSHLSSDLRLIAFIRDPVARVISAYTDKARRLVLEAKGLSETLADAGLSIEPSPSEFAENIRQYCELCPVIDSHVRAYRSFLGNDLSIYDRIYRIDEIDQFAEEMSSLAKQQLNVPQSNVATTRLHLAI